ncbi:MAG: hypothetical protein AAGK32_11565 [Actinomycetota bacterium]
MSHRSKEGRGSRRLAILRRKLHLSDDQVAELEEKFAEHRRQGRQILRDVLNDEQKERLDRHVERRRHGRRHGKREDADKA